MANELTLLNDDLKNKIITRVIEGKSYREIMTELGLKESTFYNWIWNDYKGLRVKLNEAKKEVILRESETISKQIRDMDTTTDEGKQNAKLLSIKQKEIEFLRETLGKDAGYSKRIETIGFNLNKTEPLDDKQKETLDKLLKVSGNKVPKDVEYTTKDVENTTKDVENTTKDVEYTPVDTQEPQREERP